MSENLPVRGTILSSSPCTVKDAAALLGAFLQSDTVPETGLVRGYLESVSSALEELASRPPPKRKEKKSRKHSEVEHKNRADVQGDETRAGLNAEAVNSKAEQQNGFKKGFGKKKRKAAGDDVEGNERVVKKRKLHSKEEDGSGDINSDEVRIREKPHSKKRKDRSVDVESTDDRTKKVSYSKKSNGGLDVKSDEPDVTKSSLKKRKDRGSEVDTKESEVQEKKRKKRDKQAL